MPFPIRSTKRAATTQLIEAASGNTQKQRAESSPGSDKHIVFGFVTLTQMNGICRRNSRSSGHNFGPFTECLGAGLMECLGGDQMALQIELVVDSIVNRQKSLY
jgi:hypothetical protein